MTNPDTRIAELAARLAALDGDRAAIVAEIEALRLAPAAEPSRPTTTTPKQADSIINRHSTIETKIALFRSLFRGRADVFPIRWEQTSGRQRINIHGAVDLETGQTRMIEVETADAASTIRLLESIEAFYPMLVLIHVFLDNARYHHAKIVREWLAQPGRRIKLHFIPPYCPHLNPIERLWGVMRQVACAEMARSLRAYWRVLLG